MLKVFKSDVERLEQVAAKAEAELHKIKAQHEVAIALVGKLGNEVAEAFADSAPNAEELQEAHFKAELRAGSLAKAVVTANNRYGAAKGELAEAKAKAKAEAAAAKCRDLAKALEQARRPAAEAARKFAEIWGNCPATGYYSSDVEQALGLWVRAAEFYEGDFIDLAVQSLKAHAEEILAGSRSADLGQTFDEQAVRFGRKPIAKAS